MESNAPAHPPIPEELLPAEPTTEDWVLGSPGGTIHLGYLLKRTYCMLDDGTCALAADDDQDCIVDEEIPYFDCDAPQVAPVCHVDDTRAFKQATDVVFQGSAHTYGKPRRQLEATFKLNGLERIVRVWGDRKVECRGNGVRFSDPEPFETMPLRYDRAYGGHDATAAQRYVAPGHDVIREAYPDLDRQTPFHYPRNRSGRGYLIDLDETAAAAIDVPNLDFAFDPVTPERLAVGHPKLWTRGPLPAALDWQPGTAFPRCGYLGMAPFPEGFQGEVIESTRGWAAPDLPTIEFPREDPFAFRAEFLQAASPGMTLQRWRPGSVCELSALHPERPRFRLHLPDEVPAVQVDLPGGESTALAPRLNAIVIRPDQAEVVMTWCAQAETGRAFSWSQMRDLRPKIVWRRSEQEVH